MRTDQGSDAAHYPHHAVVISAPLFAKPLEDVFIPYRALSDPE